MFVVNFSLHWPMRRALPHHPQSHPNIFKFRVFYATFLEVSVAECHPRKWDSPGGYAFNLMVLDINRRKRWQVTPIKHTMPSSALSTFHVAAAHEMDFSLGPTTKKNDEKNRQTKSEKCFYSLIRSLFSIFSQDGAQQQRKSLLRSFCLFFPIRRGFAGGNLNVGVCVSITGTRGGERAREMGEVIEETAMSTTT